MAGGWQLSVSFYRKSVLPGGLRVVTEEIPHVRSASVGIWVGAGSLWESPQSMGISHLIEHMLFKGTKERTARQIAHAIEGRGGHLNAFTSKEQTCFYTKTLDEHLSVALSVLGDMIQHSLFDSADIEKEKGVIVEEIKMYEDVPDDVVHDLFASVLWGDHPLGRPVVGTVQTVTSLSRNEILAFFDEHYVPANMVIAAAGNITHEQVLEEVSRHFAWLTAKRSSARPWPQQPDAALSSRALIRQKETEQTHLVVGVSGLEYEHPDLYALHLLNTVLGGSTSSRLFQEIREERGLAYSVYSFQGSFRSAGNFGVYAGVSPDAAGQVLELILAGLRLAGEKGLSSQELVEAKEQLKGQIMLGLESTSGRMTRLGRGELTLGRVLSPDEVIARIDDVSHTQVHQLASRLLLDEPKLLSAVGSPKADLNLPAFGFLEVSHG